MNFIKKLLDKQRPLFEKGGKLEKFYLLFEANETFLFSPASTTKPKGVQIRDAIDLKRLMMTVVIAMIPCLLFGMWNVGQQHYLAIGNPDAPSIDKWWLGFKIVIPILLVSYIAGGAVEMIFTVIRKHPLNEGYLVTGMLIPLVMPPTIPLWQVALASIFSVLIAKEAFGGTGMNILNVALTARAFLYFAYPSHMSGEIWTYLGDKTPIDGYSGATPLAIATQAVTSGENVVSSLNHFGANWADGIYSFSNMFFGFMPGSIGETSVLMSLIGAVILVITGVGSWKIIVSVFGGAYVIGTLVNILAVNSYMEMPAHYHLVIGGLAFGAVYMATDPVTASQTEKGKWIYGFLIGVLTVMIRVFNPAYPEGIMLAILLMNVFAPLIDHFIVNANKRRRLKRATI